ncbi:MAG: hypothetical protein EAZ51_05600 [Sphingobacteriales bacterium]|nr:MAG: hypothetical protein EAZ64_05625 [Sphingobacteriales bacterium]TAF80642.1 MAG: hypothetical protein EAZ51_05600 [Sphingobacteriales bacterium]
MKKITLILTALVLLSSIVFFACKKTEEVNECATLATKLAPDISAAQILYAAWLVSPKTKCAELKVAVDALTVKVSKCPTVASEPSIKMLIDEGARLNCSSK